MILTKSRFKWKRYTTIGGGVALFAFATSPVVQAADFSWNNPGGGSFQTNTNWNPLSGPPGNDDTAIFNLSSSGYTVGFNGNVQNQNIFIGNDSVRLNLGSNTYSLANDVRVGINDNDNSILELLGGGTLSSYSIGISNQPTSTAQMTVGGGSTLRATSVGGVGVDIGPFGNGILNIINGGSVVADNSQIRIGDSVNTNGIVNVTGSGSTLTTGTDLLVAINGLATLNVTDGGTVVAGDVSVGDTLFGPTGTGTVLVDGTGSTLTSLNSLFLVNNSTLDIKNGGQVEIQNNVVSGFFNLAFVDSNLNITSGGKLISGRIGNNDDPTLLLNANAMVSGTGSTWSNDGSFDMRDGSLTITSGAEVILKDDNNRFGSFSNNNVEDEVVVTVNGGSRLAIGTDPTPSLTTIFPDLILTSRSGDKESILRVSDSGSMVEIERSFHVGGSKLINRATGAETITTRLPGHVFVENGAKMTIGETLILFGESTFDLNGGTANIGAGPEPTTPDTLRVGLGGSLEGTGTVNGNVFNDGGVVSPGLSPGKLSIGGDYTQGADGTLVLEIGGTTPDLYDQLAVTGNVFLDGTLKLNFLNGFLPQTGNEFLNLITGANFSGNFANVEIAGIAPGWQYQTFFSPTGGLSIRSTSVPEPGSIASLVSILAGFGLLRRRNPKNCLRK